MIRLATALVAAFLSMVVAPSHASWGERDCSFATSGVASIPNTPTSVGGPYTLTLDGSGNILVRNGDKTTGSALLKRAPDGTALPDVGSNITASVDDALDAVQADGTILFVTGYGYYPLSIPAGVGRFGASGGLDTTFGNAGYGSVSGVSRIGAGPVVQGDGRILAGGVANSQSALIRLNADGTPDNTFGTAGLASNSGTGTGYVSIALQPDGKIVALSRTHLARHLANGQLDATFGTGGVVALSGLTTGLQVRVQPTGHLVVALTGSTTLNLSRYDTTGVQLLTRSISVPGLPSTYNILATDSSPPSPSLPLHLMADGRPVVTGTLRNLTGNSAIGAIARLNADLSDDVISVQDFIPRAAYVQPDGKILVTGYGPGQLRRMLGDADTPTCISTTTAFTSTPNPTVVGKAATLTATVAAASGPTPAGSVQFRRAGANLGTPVALVNGVATSSFNSQVAGFFDLSADYLPAAGLAGSSAMLSQHVDYGITVNDPTASALAASPSMTFTVSVLGGSSATTLTVDYATADNTAKAGTDYTAASGTLTFPLGTTSRTVVVPLAPQTVPGPNKQLFLALSNPSQYSGLVKGAGVGTITYVASGALSLYVSDSAVIEGSTGVTTLMGFTVSLSQPSASIVTVDYATADDTAIAGTDYTARSGTLTFHPGQTQQWVIVPVAGNTVAQSNRTLFVNLTNASTGTIARAQATGTIVDDDPTPAATTVPMYRLYSDVTKEHLYTTDANEYAILGTNNWAQEGTAYTMFANPGTYGSQVSIPFFRMYHPGILQHHWTTDANEVMVLASQGAWQYEGISGYLLPATDPGSTPLYRLMLPAPPLHLWTTDAYEKSVLTTPQYGWVYEGIVGEVLP